MQPTSVANSVFDKQWTVNWLTDWFRQIKQLLFLFLESHQVDHRTRVTGAVSSDWFQPSRRRRFWREWHRSIGPTVSFRSVRLSSKRCGGDDLKKTVLFGTVLVCKNGSVPDGELRKSICDQNHAQKKTRPKHIFSTALHIAVFEENSTDRKRTLIPIDPC